MYTPETYRRPPTHFALRRSPRSHGMFLHLLPSTRTMPPPCNSPPIPSLTVFSDNRLSSLIANRAPFCYVTANTIPQPYTASSTSNHQVPTVNSFPPYPARVCLSAHTPLPSSVPNLRLQLPDIHQAPYLQGHDIPRISHETYSDPAFPEWLSFSAGDSLLSDSARAETTCTNQPPHRPLALGQPAYCSYHSPATNRSDFTLQDFPPAYPCYPTEFPDVHASQSFPY